MSPPGADRYYAYAWIVDHDGWIFNFRVDSVYAVRPVISLKAGILATGSGTSDDPYLIQTR